MNGKRIIVDCKTGKASFVEPDTAFLAQRETDRIESNARRIEEDVKIAYDKKINDELRKMAEERLASN